MWSALCLHFPTCRIGWNKTYQIPRDNVKGKTQTRCGWRKGEGRKKEGWNEVWRDGGMERRKQKDSMGKRWILLKLLQMSNPKGGKFMTLSDYKLATSLSSYSMSPWERGKWISELTISELERKSIKGSPESPLDCYTLGTTGAASVSITFSFSWSQQVLLW